jgi:hypothetical protein
VRRARETRATGNCICWTVPICALGPERAKASSCTYCWIDPDYNDPNLKGL